MPAVRTISSIEVLRSGWSRVSAIGRTASSTARANRCHGGRPEPRTAARTRIRLSLASSEGWKVSDPIANQRVAPFADRPTTRTPTSSNTAAA